MTKYMITHYFQNDVRTFSADSPKELLVFLKENGVKKLPFQLEDLGNESMEVTLCDGSKIEIEEMALCHDDHNEVVFDGNCYVSIKDYANEHNCSTRKVRYAISQRYLRYIKIETPNHKSFTLVDRNGSTSRHPTTTLI